MKTLGFDISQSSTGWAVLEDKKLIASGYINLDRKQKLSANMCSLYDDLTVIINEHKPFDFICIEDTFFGKNVSTLKLLTRLGSMAVLASVRENPSATRLLLIPASWKAAIFPRQKVDSDYIFTHICAMYKLSNVPDDVTDSIGLALFPFLKKAEERWKI